MPRYSKPSRDNCPGSKMFRPSNITGLFMRSFIIFRFGLRKIFHSVTITSASAPSSAS